MITEQEYRILLMRTAAQHNAQLMGQSHLEAAAVADEADLHDQIYQECRKRGWLAFHGSMAHRTYRTMGEPDWLILGDAGRFWLVECKSRNGKLTPAQQAVAAHASKLKHTVHVIRALEHFLRIIDEDKPHANGDDATQPFLHPEPDQVRQDPAAPG